MPDNTSGVQIKMKAFFVKAVLMGVIPFYRVEFPVDVLPKEFIYIEYDHGRELGKRAIKEDDEVYTKLKTLIVQEKEGWRYDLTTYAPNHTFNSAKMKINCIDNALVVNYEDGDSDWVQISKKGVKGYCPQVYLNR